MGVRLCYVVGCGSFLLEYYLRDGYKVRQPGFLCHTYDFPDILSNFPEEIWS